MPISSLLKDLLNQFINFINDDGDTNMLVQPYKEQLFIKNKSLAAEARIIKDREAKWKLRAAWARAKQKNSETASEVRDSLYRHRMDVLRPEARAVNIARGFMKGLEYVDIERSFVDHRFNIMGNYETSSYIKLWDRVVRLVVKYGHIPEDEAYKAVTEWMKKHPQAMSSGYLRSYVALRGVKFS